MKRIIRLTESDLARIVRRVISEQNTSAKETPKECDPTTVKEIPTGKEKEYQYMTGTKAWREIGPTTKYYYCRVK
jgi:hypothetical protein